MKYVSPSVHLLIIVLIFLNISCGENRVAEAHRKQMEAAAADTVLSASEKAAIEANKLKNEAMDLVMASKPDEAAVILKKAIALNPTEHNLYYQRGLALIDAGKPEEAYNDLTKAIQLNPRHANTLKARGHASLNMGRYDDAINDLNMALEITPRDAHAYVHRARARLAKGQRKTGCSDLKKADYLRTVNVEDLLKENCGA
jgi:tetratricopeptide (TPR) repeat protein